MLFQSLIGIIGYFEQFNEDNSEGNDVSIPNRDYRLFRVQDLKAQSEIHIPVRFNP